MLWLIAWLFALISMLFVQILWLTCRVRVDLGTSYSKLVRVNPRYELTWVRLDPVRPDFGYDLTWHREARMLGSCSVIIICILFFVNVALKDNLQIISCFVSIDNKMPELSWKMLVRTLWIYKHVEAVYICLKVYCWHPDAMMLLESKTY